MRRLLIIAISVMVCLGAYAQDDTAVAHPSPLTSPREYDVLFHEAMLQRQKGNADAAFDLLCRCQAMNPEASEVYFFLAQYHAEMRHAEQALACVKRAAELAPDNMTYLETLAQAYIGQKEYREAIAVVERMYELDKGRQELLETLCRLYLQENDYERAVDVIDRMELIDGKSERTALAKSGLYLQMDQTERALDEVKALAEQHPNDLNYLTLYANTLLMNGEPDAAYDLLQQVLDEEPDNLRAQQVLRNYYVGEEDYEAADSLTHRMLLNPRASTEEKVQQLRQIIAENEQDGGDSTLVLGLFAELLQQPSPDPDIAEMRAGYMELKQMPRDSLVGAFEYVLQLAPDRAWPRLRLVQFAWENDDDQRIVALCQTARQYNPEEMAFYYYQGMAYYRQDDTDHALEAFQNGISVINDQSSPEIVSDFYAVMGDLLMLKHQNAAAFAAYDSCLQWKSDNISCMNNYAYNLSLQGSRLDEAEQMSYKTVKAEPQNATYLDTYAWILFMQTRYAEARIYIDQALQNDSTASAVITEHAGDIYAQCGMTEKAIELWQQAQLQDPANKLLARKIKRKKYIKP